MKTAVIVLSIIALVLAGSTYYLYGQKNKLALQSNMLEQEKDEIAGKLEAKIEDISRKEEEIARVTKVCDVLVRDMKSEVERGQVKITQLADRLSVVMVDKILFPSGDAEITSDGVGILERVGKVLKDTQDRIIRVEGHTDNLPIRPRLQEEFPTNWELSTARATNVVRFLQERVGIEGKRWRPSGCPNITPWRVMKPTAAVVKIAASKSHCCRNPPSRSSP
jgi:chemotaxis protein MotB